MYPDGKFFQEFGESEGTIAKDVIGDLTKPYLYAVFILNGTNVAFNKLKDDELDDSYRYKAIRKTLKRL